MQNHGSIGLFQEWCVWLWAFRPFPFLFFCLAWCESDTGTTIWLVTRRGSFMCLKWWFLFFSLLLVTILYIIQTLPSPTTFLYILLLLSSDLWSGNFLFLSFAFLQSLIGKFSFFFLFFCFPPIFDWGFSLFLLLFEAHLQLNSKWSFSFFWEILMFFLLRVRIKNSYPWSRFMAEGLRFWLKRLRKARHGICQGIYLASGSEIRECPTSFPWHAHNNDDLEIYAKLIMHAPMWTLKHQVLWPCNTKA